MWVLWKKTRRILDLGCGIGRHSLEFARNSFCHVDGVDISEKYLEIAKKRATHNKCAKKNDFFRGNILNFKYNNKYDVICLLINTFDYFKDRKKDGRLLKIVKDNLKKAGTFVFEVTPFENILDKFEKKTFSETKSHYVFVNRTLKNKLLNIKWEFFDKNPRGEAYV